MFSLFAAPAVGQEAGDKARGLFRVELPSQLDSIRNMVGSDQLIRRGHWGPEGFVGIEGVITPGLQLETENGTIVAKGLLTDPEYWDPESEADINLSPGSALGLVVAPGVAWKLFEIVAGGTFCTAIGSLTPGENDPGESGFNECTSGGTSWGKSMGIGAGAGLLALAIVNLKGGSWQPW